jgi:hypothetical protein
MGEYAFYKGERVKIGTCDDAKRRGQPTEGNRETGRRLHLIADRLLAGYDPAWLALRGNPTKVSV